MRFDTFFVGVMIATLMITAGVIIINDQRSFDSTYSGDNSTFHNISKNINLIENNVSSIKEILKEEKSSSIEIFSDLLKAGRASITVFLTLLSVPMDLINQTVGILNIPTAISVIVSVIIIILMISGLIYMFFRFQPR